MDAVEFEALPSRAIEHGVDSIGTAHMTASAIEPDEILSHGLGAGSDRLLREDLGFKAIGGDRR